MNSKQKGMRLVGWLSLSLLLAGFWMRLRTFPQSQSQTPAKVKELIEKDAEGLFSASQIPFIVSVSAFETGDFKSPVLVENNNLFGMKLPKKRPTTATGENRGHATYNSLTDSIVDFYLWHRYVNFPEVNRLRRFIRAMKDRSYFEADFNHYLKGASHYFDKYYNFNATA